MRSAEGVVVLKGFFSILSDLIFDSKVDPGRPSLAAAPDGPDTCPPLSRGAASIISFSWAASFPGSSSWLFDPIAPRLSDLPSVSCRKMEAEQEDSSFQLLQTRDGAVLPVPTTAASRR